MKRVSKKLANGLKMGVAAMALVTGMGANGFTSEAAWDAKYYNIVYDGGMWDGNQYLLDGKVITDAFFCDGTYTYFLQADGTPMKDRLTYHPDGKQVIYFDAEGHECFDTFAHVRKSIAGEEVDDLCYFGSTGDLYVNVITYNKEGTAIYYANQYGVMPREGGFEVDSRAINYEALANGCKYGYANPDGTITAFFKTVDDLKAYLPADKMENIVSGSWNLTEEISYDQNGNVVSRITYKDEGATKTEKTYTMNEGKEYLSKYRISYYGEEDYGNYQEKNYELKNDGSGETYLSKEEIRKGDKENYHNYVISYKYYNEEGNLSLTKEAEYLMEKIQKASSTSFYDGDKLESTDTYYYEDGKLVKWIQEGTEIYNSKKMKTQMIAEYTEDENVSSYTYYRMSNGSYQIASCTKFFYEVINGKSVLKGRELHRSINSLTGCGGLIVLFEGYDFFYDKKGNCIREEYYFPGRDGEKEIQRIAEREYKESNLPGTYLLTKDMTYIYDKGEKIPYNGYEYEYDKASICTKKINYWRNGDEWSIAGYETYNYHLDELGKRFNKIGATCTLKYKEEYNDYDSCKGYTERKYVFAPDM